jgi:hypothetical protein
VLRDSFQQASPEITAEIVFTNPKETRRSSSQKLSLWLYRVTEDEFLKNQPMERAGVNRINGADSDRTRTDRVAPLALNLFYLLTPMASLSNPTEVDSDLSVLGQVMHALYDNAIIQLRSPAENVAEELRIILCRLTLEELTRVWEALQEPYRLSVCYQVRVVRIDSDRTQTHGRVTERRGRYAEQPAATEE